MYYLQFYGRTIFVVFVLLPKYTAVWQMVVLHGLSEMAVLRWNKWFAQNYYTSLSDLVERMTMWSPDCEFNALTLESPHNPAIFILSNSWTIASSPYFSPKMWPAVFILRFALWLVAAAFIPILSWTWKSRAPWFVTCSTWPATCCPTKTTCWLTDQHQRTQGAVRSTAQSVHTVKGQQTSRWWGHSPLLSLRWSTSQNSSYVDIISGPKAIYRNYNLHRW